MRFPKPEQYPRSIRVRKKVYRIRFVKEIEEDPRLEGLCISNPPLILIKEMRSRRKMFDTAIHEILHAIEFEYDLKIRHSLIYALAKAWTILIKRNF